MQRQADSGTEREERRLGVNPEPESHDQFDFQPVIDAASSQTEDNVFDHDPVILCTPDPQPVPHSIKTSCRFPASPSLMLVMLGNLMSPNQSKCFDLDHTLKRSLQVSAEGVDGPHPKAVSNTQMIPQKPRQIVLGDWVLCIRPPQAILKKERSMSLMCMTGLVKYSKLRKGLGAGRFLISSRFHCYL